MKQNLIKVLNENDYYDCLLCGESTCVAGDKFEPMAYDHVCGSCNKGWYEGLEKYAEEIRVVKESQREN